MTHYNERESLREKSNRRVQRAVSGTLLVLAVLLSGPARSAPTSFYELPDIFTNDQGRKLHLSEWRGKPMILSMEYSECRFMCSTTFSQLRELQAAADKKKNPIDFMIISLDPDNDTPEAWRQYRQTKNIERSNWHLLTGSRDTTNKIAALLGIKFWRMDEHILHDFKVVRLNANGEIEKEVTAYGIEPEYLLQ
jgi:protein SCO1/2